MSSAILLDMTTHRREKHHKARLDSRAVRFIRTHPELSNADLARKYGVERSTIRLVRANVSWRDPAYTPEPSHFRGQAIAPEYRKLPTETGRN